MVFHIYSRDLSSVPTLPVCTSLHGLFFRSNSPASDDEIIQAVSAAYPSFGTEETLKVLLEKEYLTRNIVLTLYYHLFRKQPETENSRLKRVRGYFSGVGIFGIGWIVL